MLGLSLSLANSNILSSGGAAPSSALSLDFKNSVYSVGGTSYSPITAIPGYSDTRAGQVGAVDLSGNAAFFAANVAPINSAGYFPYPAVTCANAKSQTLDTWSSPVDVVITANTQVAPDGTTTADTMAEDAINSQHYAFDSYSVSTPAGVNTQSSFVKQGTARYVQLLFANALNSTAYVNFDLQTGTVTAAGGGATGYIVACANGWYRIVMTATLGATTGQIIISPALINSGTDARLPSYIGTSRTVYVWQTQLIGGDFHDGGPLIVTTSAAASIGAEAMTVNIPNGTYSAVYTFGDATTQTIPTTISGGTYTVPLFPATLTNSPLAKVVLT